MRHAIVFSGGGPLVFWEAGIATGLREAGIQAEHYAGTSAGAIVALLAALGRPERLVEIAESVTGRELFGTVGGALGPVLLLRRLLRTGGLFDPEPLRRVIAQEAPDAALDLIPPGRLAVSAWDYRTGLAITFRPEQWQPSDFRAAVLASASLPGVYAPVRIDAGDGRVFELADGGVADNLPLEDVVYRELAPGADREPLTLWSVAATQPYPAGDLRGEGLGRLAGMAERIVSQHLFAETRRSEETAQSLGFGRVRLLRVRAPRLSIPLLTYTSAQALEAFEIGRKQAAELNT